VDEIDSKKIDIEISPVSKDVPLENRYAKVKVNKSSTIINLKTGKQVYKYSLEDIDVLSNNVFSIESKSLNLNNEYIVIGDNKVKLKTTKYMRVRVDDIDSNIAIGINDDTSISYINLDNQEEINNDKNNDYNYGDGIVLEKTHNFSSDKDIYNIITSKGKIASFDTYIPVTGEFKDKKLNVKIDENKYNYINTKGKLVNNSKYDTASEYNDGYAIVSRDNRYGVINTKGKENIKLSYNKIDFLDDEISKILKNKYDKELFVYQDENSKYGIINSKDKTVVSAKFDNIKYITDKYPIIKVR
jgi:hypothetical protein